MEGECKVTLDTAVDKDTEKQATQRLQPSSKITTALLVFTLCLAAAAVLIVNRHTEVQGQNEDNFHHTLRQISNIRAAIHLEGVHNSKLNTSVEWKDRVDQSHSQGGLELKNNEIVIPRDGLYFVYSQASFRVSCRNDNADDTSSHPMVHLSHTVQRWSRSYGNDDVKRDYATILHSIRTACQKTTSSDSDEDGSWYSAVYMGAVFNLYSGDTLRTLMEEEMLNKLEDDPGKTFFGVFAL